MKKIILLFLIWACTSCQAPQPLTLVVLFDVSASFAKERQWAMTHLERMLERLDPQLDRVYVLTLSQGGTQLIKEGKVPSVQGIKGILASYAKTQNPAFKGTPYQEGLQRIVNLLPKEGHRGVVIFGDFANENVGRKGANLTASYLAQLGDKWPRVPLAVLGLDPRFESHLDPFRQGLGSLLIVGSAAQEQTSAQGLYEFLELVQR